MTIARDAFQVQQIGGDLVGLNAVQNDTSGRSVVTLTFAGAGIVGGSLADGNYELTIAADQVHTENYLLDGDGDGSSTCRDDNRPARRWAALRRLPLRHLATATSMSVPARSSAVLVTVPLQSPSPEMLANR